MSKIDRFPKFPVSFTIKLISSYENSAILFASRQNDNVCRYSLIRFDLDNVTNLQILTRDFFGPRFLYECVSLVISLVISFLTVVIIVAFFHKCEA